MPRGQHCQARVGTVPGECRAHARAGTALSQGTAVLPAPTAHVGAARAAGNEAPGFVSGGIAAVAGHQLSPI